MTANFDVIGFVYIYDADPAKQCWLHSSMTYGNEVQERKSRKSFIKKKDPLLIEGFKANRGFDLENPATSNYNHKSPVIGSMYTELGSEISMLDCAAATKLVDDALGFVYTNNGRCYIKSYKASRNSMDIGDKLVQNSEAIFFVLEWEPRLVSVENKDKFGFWEVELEQIVEGYSLYDIALLGGNEYGEKVKVNFDPAKRPQHINECKALCDKDPMCGSFFITHETGEDWYCSMKVTGAVLEDGSIAGSRIFRGPGTWIKKETKVIEGFVTGRGYTVQDVKDKKPDFEKVSHTECAEKCVDGCAGVAFEPRSGNCFISTTTAVEENADFIFFEKSA